MHDAKPVESQERISSLDALRGFSLLGILLLNIVSFGLPFAAYMNPSVAGGATGPDLNIWLVAMTFWDGKMRCLFSMLFGAGAVILLGRAERRGAGIEAADIYYRRTIWLIVFGLLHAHLIWYGDILYAYGVIGLLLFPLRNLSAKALLVTGLVIVAIHSVQGIGAGVGIAELQEKATVQKDEKAIKEWQQLEEMFAPPQSKIQEETKNHHGGWVDNLMQRSPTAAMFQTSMFFQFAFLDVLGMLILGMGLYKAGVFDASRSMSFYGAMAAGGLAIGAPLNYWAASKWVESQFAIPAFFTYIGSTADIGRFAVALGYTGIVMMLCKAGVRFLTAPLAAVGRMALTNYLLTSILMTMYFDGWGGGRFGTLSRHQLYYVVLGMWAINLILSPIWLRYFQFGPAEWAWRSLTYWKKQPMLLAQRDSLAGAQSPVVDTQ